MIASILERELGVTCFINPNLNTDLLGTFTGEIERNESPINTARKKCLMAMEQSNYDMAIASEGSFGPHPSLFFIPADDELVFLLDKKNNIEIWARELSTETNFYGAQVKNQEELLLLAQQVYFPSHGLIIRKEKNDFSEIRKGIIDWEILKSEFNYFFNTYGSAFIETDMRAIYNPTRMKQIEKATVKLIEKINTHCPQCNTPGFAISEVRQGLPCELCNFPTKSTISHVYLCQKCTFCVEKKYPNGKEKESPMYCNLCNP